MSEKGRKTVHSSAAADGIRCPECRGFITGVYNSRPSSGCIRRRRLCCGCGNKFTTVEVNAEIDVVTLPWLSEIRALTKEQQGKLRKLIAVVAGPEG